MDLEVSDEARPSPVEPGDGDEAVGSTQVVKSFGYAGPLPLPRIAEEYERILPGAAERIVSMAERQAAHRQTMESKDLDGYLKDRRAARVERAWGMALGFVLAAGALVVAAIVQGVVGGIIGAGGLATLAGAFLAHLRAPRPKEDDRDGDD